MTVTLASLLMTDYRRRVLGLLLLHPDRSFHLREIARLTGTVPGTLNRELTKLADAGLLTRERVGNQMRYAASRDCPIFEELASIMRKTSALAEVLAQGLLPLADRIVAAFVFGSVASGKATSGSDIDLMVIGSLGYDELVVQLHPLQATLGREINPKLFTPSEWQELVRKQGAFVRDLLDKPRLFVIGNDGDLGNIRKRA